MNYNLSSYAKVNLFLHVIGRDFNNYHLIQSAINFIDLSDNIFIEDSNQLEIKFLFNEKIKYQLIDKENNSIKNIIDEFSQKFNLKNNFRIHVEKNIPSGAGLGGGSSNAATVLKFLIQYHNIDISDQNLKNLALKVGCDTVAFLYNKPVFVEGIGERIFVCELDKTILKSHILIIYPQIFSSSGEVYKHFKENNYKFSDEINFNRNKIIDLNFLKRSKNDLEESASKLFPEIKELLIFLNEICYSKNVLIRMSGSGSTCFVLSEDKLLLEQIEKIVIKKYQKYFLKICNLAL
jgi:4-diphosphocytidyl-2-C-methyl-D-erythritol kinase